MRKIFAIYALAILCMSCGDDMDPGTPGQGPINTISEDAIFWTGPEITFTLGDGLDHRQEVNQDRLTDNVIITRSTVGGQIFNFVTETAASSSVSPQGTEWAIGRSDNAENIVFAPFRDAVGDPRDRVVGQELVLHLIEDDIYIDVTFTSWSRQRNGGFSYIRTTP
jgi:hypothetical protein